MLGRSLRQASYPKRHETKPLLSNERKDSRFCPHCDSSPDRHCSISERDACLTGCVECNQIWQVKPTNRSAPKKLVTEFEEAMLRLRGLVRDPDYTGQYFFKRQKTRSH
jgi:hypothetical protein